MTASELMQQAIFARKNAYAPYSHYCVGAALLTAENKVYLGCNIENASYGATICAERVAIFKAISEGERYFAAIAIAGGPENALEDELSPAPPCGICRQVMAEFCGSAFRIYFGSKDNPLSCTLGEILPHQFSL